MADEKKRKSNAGRPKKPIDYQQVEKLAKLMCTQEEIATMLEVSTKTLQRDEQFCLIYKKGIEDGKMSLRRIQWKHAESNPAMAMFLGKNMLGQRDRQETQISGGVSISIVGKAKEWAE